MPDLDRLAQNRNRLLNAVHTWLLAGGSLLLLGVTAWAFAGWTGIVWATLFGGLSLLAVSRASPAMVLKMYKARAVTRAEFPQGVDLVAELARRAGLPSAPRLHVVPSRLLNAFAVGRRDDAAIAVTDALLQRLTLRELAGVLAHEVSHIAHGDIKVMALADVVSRFTALMSTVGLFSLFFNLVAILGGMAPQVPWIAIFVLLASPTVGGLLQLALSRTREFAADLGAATLTGDPDGLASALAKLERWQGRMWEAMVLPGGRTPVPSVLRSHPRTEDRIARLMALKAVGGADIPAVVVQPVRRPSLVPHMPKAARMAGTLPRHPTLSFLAAGAGGDMPASPRALNPADGDPRIRISRGGVWW